MEAKSLWQSKTFWANVVALVAAVGVYVQSKDMTALLAAGMAVLNMILRYFTKQPIE